jgi:aminoglycoside phosphotransferase (APT) family kinase protein
MMAYGKEDGTPQALPDPRAILDALGWSARAETITPVAGGSDTALWRVERDGHAYALRLFRAGEGAVARREERAMRLTVPGVPIPMVRAAGVCEDRPALLIDWCPGRTLLDALRAEPRRAWALARSFGATQARLHAATPPAALREGGRPWIDWVGAGAGALGARLRAVASDTPSVLHLDYHPLNVLVDAGRVSGVIDWANVHVGDRRADVARTLTLLLLAPLPPDGSVRLLRALARALAAGWRRGYRAVAGPLGGMAPFYAWAGTALINDLAPRVDRPGGWLRSAHLDPACRWTAHWRARVGLPADR